MKRIRLLMLIALLGLMIVSVNAQDDVVLVVWDNYHREAEQEAFAILDEIFMEAHPGVIVQRQSYTYDDLGAIVPLALSDPDGPDVAQVNQGFIGMGPLVEADLLVPLNDYADEFGWWDRYAMGLHSRNMFSSDGMNFGGDTLYAMSNTAEVVGVFYHKDMFESMGLTVPETWDEFVALVEAIKAADTTPIIFGSLDGWPAIHTWGAIQHAFIESSDLDDFMYRRDGATFVNDANQQSAEVVVDWVEKGYYSPGFEGMDYDNATFNAFLNQDGAMWITGNWMSGSIIAELGDESVGFFLVPSAIEGNPPLSIGSVGLGYAIRNGSENQDLAAAYIDVVTGPEAAAALFELGFVPASAISPDMLEEGTITADIVQAFNTIGAENAVGHFIDQTATEIASDLQELLAGQVSPEEFVANVESDYVAGGE